MQKITNTKMYFAADKNASGGFYIYTIDPRTYDIIIYAKNFDTYDSALNYYSNKIKPDMSASGNEPVIYSTQDSLQNEAYALKENEYYKDWLTNNSELTKSFGSEFVPDYSVPIRVTNYDQHKVNVINAYERAYHTSDENRMTSNDEHMEGMAVVNANVSPSDIFERYGTILENDTLALAKRINSLFEEYDKYNHKGESADKERTIGDYNKSIKDGKFDVNISSSMIDIATCGIAELEGRAKTLVNQYSLQVKENSNYNAERLSYVPKVITQSDTNIYKQNKTLNKSRKQSI